MNISIVIPTYNRPDLTINTANMAQRAMIESEYGFEIIICENPSPNNIKRSDLPSSCKYYLWDTNIGPYNNWIEALKISQYKVCLLLFSDDNLIRFNLDKNIYTQIAERKICYSTCRVSIYDSQFSCVNAINIYKNFRSKDKKNLLMGLLLGSRGYPVSPAASIFNTDILLEALINYSTKFQFGFDNGAGPDLYSYIYPLVNNSISIHNNLSEIVFTAHQNSLSTNPNSAFRVMVNYTALRLLLASRLDSITYLDKFRIFFHLYFYLGNWNYKYSLKMIFLLYSRLNFPNKMLLFFGTPSFLIGIGYSIIRSIYRKYFL